MSIALILICTGKDYWRFAQPAIDSAKRFFPADILLFTDSPSQYDVAKQVTIPHAGWPNVTLMRYHTMLGQREWLSGYSHIFYLDIDMEVVGPVGEEILSDGITATVHSSFEGRPSQFTPETNPRSTACLSKSQIRNYYTGCFIGGESKAFLSMCEVISKNTDTDNANNFIAMWHDESHLVRYLYDHPPTLELHEPYNAWTKKSDSKIWRVPKGADGKAHVPNRNAVNGVQPPNPRNA